MITIRIGIVSWNTSKVLPRCLDTIPAAVDGAEAQVVLVDNASTDDSVSIARRYASVHVIRNPVNVGYARAMNQALAPLPEVDPPEVMVALNPDTELTPGSLRVLAERLLDQPDVGLVVPRLINRDGTPQHSVYAFPSCVVSVVAGLVPIRWQGGLGSKWWLEGAANHNRRCDIDWAIGAVHVIRPLAVDPYRPYPERWYMYAEDLDLCWNLDQQGWRRRLEGDVSITHVGNASGSQAWGSSRVNRWLDATYDWYRLRRGPGRTRLWAAVNLVGSCNRAAVAAVAVCHRPIAQWERDIVRSIPVHIRALFRPYTGGTVPWNPEDSLASDPAWAIDR